MVNVLIFTCFLHHRNASVPWSVHVLRKIQEQCNKSSNVTSNGKRLHMKLGWQEGCGPSKSAQVEYFQALSKHNMVLESFIKIGPD